MPNKKSARKRVRQNEKHRAHNRTIRSEMRTSVKKARKNAAAGVLENLDTLVSAAQSQLGKASKTKLIKKNAMSRLQSRIMRAANKARAAAAPSA